MSRYMTIEERNLLRAIAAKRVQVTSGGQIIMRSHGWKGHRPVKTLVEKAITEGWVGKEPDGDGLYQLTEDGRDALAAREASTGRRPS